MNSCNVAGPPLAPRNLTAVEVYADRCTLKWQPPEFDGGAPISGYFIERKAPYNNKWVKVNKSPITELTADQLDLDDGTQYQYRVIAQNEAGLSEPSEPINVLAKDPWGKYIFLSSFYI